MSTNACIILLFPTDCIGLWISYFTRHRGRLLMGNKRERHCFQQQLWMLEEGNVSAYQIYEKVINLGREDVRSLDLLEQFIAAGQDHFGSVTLARDRGDTLGRVMSALYALNGHLRKNFPDDFPAGFYPGTPEEIEDMVGELLAEIYFRRQR